MFCGAAHRYLLSNLKAPASLSSAPLRFTRRAPVLTSCFVVGRQEPESLHGFQSCIARQDFISKQSQSLRTRRLMCLAPEMNRNSKRWKKEPLRRLVSASLCLVRSACMLFVSVVSEVGWTPNPPSFSSLTFLGYRCAISCCFNIYIFLSKVLSV